MGKKKADNPSAPSAATPPAPSPPTTPSSASRAEAQLQVTLARQKLAQAEAALEAAVEIDLGEKSVSRAEYQVAVAARLRAVIFARHEARLRYALQVWANAAPSSSSTDDAALEAGGGAEAGGVLEVVLNHLRPVALQWALHTWSRITYQIIRTAAWHATLEGKFAMQKAMVLEDKSREQLIRGVVRWWTQGDLQNVWKRWVEMARSVELPAKSVRVSLS